MRSHWSDSYWPADAVANTYSLPAGVRTVSSLLLAVTTLPSTVLPVCSPSAAAASPWVMVTARGAGPVSLSSPL